jgi:two-component system KDP operon response regulator KdpE
MGAKNEKTVLIVEDDTNLLKIYASLLRVHLDASVFEAADGAAALAALADRLPELVLLDLGLPDVPYVPLIANIAEIYKKAGREAQIIVISGKKSAREEVLALEGVAGFYYKPQSFQTVVEIARLHFE